MELNVERDKEENVSIDDVDRYLSETLGKVGKKLPQRSVRFGNKKSPAETSTEDGHKKSLSLRDYVAGRQGLTSNILSESSVFHNQTPPNFTELTHRIMSQDPHWTKVMKHFPIDSVSRMLDMLPGLFIVLGVFGTFIGLSMALPEIAKIDFDDLAASEQTINAFVLNVTYAMKTSIAGIFLSMILTVMNTLSPIRQTRARVFKKVESALQMLWYHVQQETNKDKSSEFVNTKLLKVLEKLEARLDKESKHNDEAA